ncbi:MAG: O-antigen ligase family protein [Bacilli bacterium]|nr:O-antigen ligase family protein [Bacilli bacterium]
MKKQYINFIKIFSILFVINIHVLSKAWNVCNPLSFNFKLLTFIDIIFHVCVPLFVMCSGNIFLNRDDNLKKILTKYTLKMYLVLVLFSILYKTADIMFLADSTFTFKTFLIILKDSLLFKTIYHLWYLKVVIGMYLSIPIFKLLFKIKYKYIDHLILLLLVLIFKVLPIFISNGIFTTFISVEGFIIYFYLGYYLEKYFSKKLLYFGIPIFIFSYYYSYVMTVSLSIENNLPTLNYIDYLSYNIMGISIFAYLIIYNFKHIFDKSKFKNIIEVLSKYNFYIYLFHGFTIALLYKLKLINLYHLKTPLIVFVYGIIVYILTLLYVIPIKEFMLCDKKLLLKRMNNFINKYLSKIIVGFIFIQPILDLLSSLEINVLHIGLSMGSIVRFIFMLLCIYYVLFISKEKKYKYVVISILVYIFLFMGTILYFKGFNIISYEMRNCLYTYFLPVILIALYLIFKNKAVNIKLNHIFILYIIYLIFILIPNLTHTGFDSYWQSKVGSTGWFYSANSLGNFISIIMPFIFYYLIKSKINIFLKGLVIVSSLYVFVSIGTKVPVIGFLLCLLVHFIYYIINSIKSKKYKLLYVSLITFIVGVILSIIVVPKTSFYKNLEIHRKFLGVNHYYEVFTDYKLVDHFIFSQRLTFLKNSNNNFKDVSITEKALGMGYIENYSTDKMSDKTIEMDYFEVFYRHGLIGCIIFYLVFIPFIVTFFKTKQDKSLLNIEFKLSIVLILLLSLFSGHVLVTPSISIFVALIINIFINRDNYYNFGLNS